MRYQSHRTLFSQLRENRTKIAAIGSGCTLATEPSAEISHFWNIPQVQRSFHVVLSGCLLLLRNCVYRINAYISREKHSSSCFQNICLFPAQTNHIVFVYTLKPTRSPVEDVSNGGVSNRWNGIWNGTVEWKMEWNGEYS